MADLTLAPPPYHTVLDTAGHPVPNACIWTYVAGTTTPAATYSDALATPNTNPIRADSAGRFTAYLVAGAAYLFVYEQPATPPAHGAVIRTQDNIVGTPAAPAVFTGTWIPTLGGTTTYTQQEGSYVRAGALVFARGSLTVAALGTGTGYIINGLPFAVFGDTPVVIGLWSGLPTPFVWVGGYVPAGNTQIFLLGIPAAAVGAPPAVLLGDGSAIQFSLTCQTSAA